MLIRPHITEKSMADVAKKLYTFVVSTSDTKTDIKRLVENTFKVNVLSVKTAIMPGRSYRTGRRGLTASRSEWKKAIVGIKPDQKIELFDTPESK